MPSKTAPIKSGRFTAVDLFVWAFLLITCAFAIEHAFGALTRPIGMHVGELDFFEVAKIGLLVATKIGLSIALGAAVFCIFQAFVHDHRANLKSRIWKELLVRYSSPVSRSLPGQFRPPRFID